MTMIDYINTLWSCQFNTAEANEYRRIYALMEKGEITPEQCYNKIQQMINDPYYWSRDERYRR